jgi:MiaB/RimO family radical SAM methylthiotransferase
VKGKLFSYPMDAIRQDVKSHLKAGCKEIWITSNDTGAYMAEQGGKQKIVELLENILSVPVDFKLRLGMMNPGNTITILNQLIKIYKNPKMFKFLHIPMQSGNDDILKLMNRKYNVNDFIKVIEAFRKEIPEITISTDIIVGFPSETEGQFQDSLNLVEKIKPDVLNISRYAAREGTIAAKMKQHSTNELKRRSRLMTELYRKIAFENNKKWLNWQGKILIDEKGSKEGSFIGRNYCYKPVVVKRSFNLGDEVDVKITDTTIFDLRGENLQ